MEFLGFGSFNLWVGPDISKVRIDVAGIPVLRRGPPVSNDGGSTATDVSEI